VFEAFQALIPFSGLFSQKRGEKKYHPILYLTFLQKINVKQKKSN